ncbi:MAG: glycerophosphoryl diester phosphodiesterase [Elusimicrobia bacterium]|nr:MAG: glycerophosphoryl diester phosphodiesterase [Elusimicrobiota bacterium]
MQYYIEAKTALVPAAGDPAPEALAALIVAELCKADAVRRSVLQSFDYRILSAARALEPALRIAALSRDFLEDLPKTAERLRADDVAAYRPVVSPGLVAALHRRGVRVVAWTANDPEEWEALVGSRVDGIITDDPEALIGWLGTRP